MEPIYTPTPWEPKKTEYNANEYWKLVEKAEGKYLIGAAMKNVTIGEISASLDTGHISMVTDYLIALCDARATTEREYPEPPKWPTISEEDIPFDRINF